MGSILSSGCYTLILGPSDILPEAETIPPEAQRVMAQRAGSHAVEIQSSHVALISRPDVVTELIGEATGCR